MPAHSVHHQVPKSVTASFTLHAQQRMSQRHFTDEAVNLVLMYGRAVHTRGAEIFALGRKEVERCREEGLELERYEGIQVVCGEDGAVLTVYRNRDFRGLRRGGRAG